MAVVAEHGGVPGGRCAEAGCEGRSVAAGRCLAHIDDDALKVLIDAARPDKPFDGRRANVDAALFQRLLVLAPVGTDGRPALPAVDFADAAFTGLAAFDGVTFTKDACFDRATFRRGASFDEAVFQGHARFGGATFGALTGFANVCFQGHAWFPGASFAAEARFDEARFEGPAWFGAATFDADVIFNGASFVRDVSFDETSFGCHVAFADTVFERDAALAAAWFANEALYDGARFEGPSGAPAVASRDIEWTGASLATWTDRVKAAVIDLTVPAAFLLGAVVLTMVLPRLHYYGLGPYVVALAILAGAAYVVRNLVHQGYTGQTVGKERLGLTLVRKNDGLPVGVRASLVRYALHAVDTAPGFAGWLVPLWNPTRQTFADQISTTVVACQRGWAGAAPPARASGVPEAGFG